jgi:hypothetical protein
VRLFKFAESHWQKAATPTAVSPTCAKASLIRLKNHHSTIGCKFLDVKGCPQAAVASSDNGDITLQVMI